MESAGPGRDPGPRARFCSNSPAIAKLHGAALVSAEVIAGTPSSRSGVLPLANFGNVSFTNATANGAALGNMPGLDPITMRSGSTVKAQPSNITGGSFSVTWKHP